MCPGVNAALTSSETDSILASTLFAKEPYPYYWTLIPRLVPAVRADRTDSGDKARN